MPNCFSLTRKSEPGSGPVSLIQIDEEICKHLNVEHDPVKYYKDWHDNIGFALACGRDFAWIRYAYATYYDVEWLPIIDYLDANFKPNIWYEHK